MTAEELLVQIVPAWRAELPREQAAALTLGSRGETRAELRERAEPILVRGGLSGVARGILRAGLENDSDDLADRVAKAEEDYERRRAG